MPIIFYGHGLGRKAKGFAGAMSRRVKSRERRRAGLVCGRVQRFVFKIVGLIRVLHTLKIFKMEIESFKLFKEYSEAAIVKKRKRFKL